MDFIERLFGISPDGGNGSTEALWLAGFAAAVIIALAFGARMRARRRRR
jgi:hypothetical protein